MPFLVAFHRKALSLGPASCAWWSPSCAFPRKAVHGGLGEVTYCLLPWVVYLKNSHWEVQTPLKRPRSAPVPWKKALQTVVVVAAAAAVAAFATPFWTFLSQRSSPLCAPCLLAYRVLQTWSGEEAGHKDSYSFLERAWTWPWSEEQVAGGGRPSYTSAAAASAACRLDSCDALLLLPVTSELARLVLLCPMLCFLARSPAEIELHLKRKPGSHPCFADWGAAFEEMKPSAYWRHPQLGALHLAPCLPLAPVLAPLAFPQPLQNKTSQVPPPSLIRAWSLEVLGVPEHLKAAQE